MLQSGCVARLKVRNQIREIEQAFAVRPDNGPPSQPALTQYMGQKYTRVQVLRGPNQHSRLVTLKPIDARDQRLFLLSVTDCGGALRKAGQP